MHLVEEQLQALHLHLRAGKAVEDDAVAVSRLEGAGARAGRSPRGPRPCCPASFIRRASGVSSRALITIGPQVRPRVFAMNRCSCPCPRRARRPRRMISLGKRRFSRPNSGLQILPDRAEDELGVLDLQVRDPTGGKVPETTGCSPHTELRSGVASAVGHALRAE